MAHLDIRLATRGSPLALWQAHYVQRLLEPASACKLVVLESHGDRDQTSALNAMGGFGVFTKVVQQALVDHQADVSVHSLKDLPTIPCTGVELVCVPPRGPVQDAFVSQKYRRFSDLPKKAIVGTSSLRRRAMLLNQRPDLRLVDLRGNIATRLQKLIEQELDAIVLAAAGLVRLGLEDQIRELLDPNWCLPAVGQGAIGLEIRTEDQRSRLLLEGINDATAWSCTQAERAMLAALGGGCLVPIGVVSDLRETRLHLRAMVCSIDGKRCIVASHAGPANTPLAVGQELAAKLIDEGASELLIR